jgi:hypothetical protein
MLQGCTPLHCAALRGNPAHINHLLRCGADPMKTSAAGMLPLEMVPLCGDRDANLVRICRCMNEIDAVEWECRSRAAREMLMQALLGSFSVGLQKWLCTCIKVARCWLGLWGMNPMLWRPALQSYMLTRCRAISASQRQTSIAEIARVREICLRARTALCSASEGLTSVLTGHSQLITSIPVSENCDAFTAIEREPEARTPCHHQCWAELKPNAESIGTHADAMAAADAALEGFADAARCLSRLQTAGFLLRPTQLRAAANCQGNNGASALLHTVGLHHICGMCWRLHCIAMWDTGCGES